MKTGPRCRRLLRELRRPAFAWYVSGLQVKVDLTISVQWQILLIGRARILFAGRLTSGTKKPWFIWTKSSPKRLAMIFMCNCVWQTGGAIRGALHSISVGQESRMLLTIHFLSV